MKSWTKHHRHSLSGKLLMLFVLTALLVVALVGGGVGKFFRLHFEENIQPHLMQYLEYIQQDIGIPPDRQRALELAKRLKVDIYFIGPEGRWSSNGRSIDFQALKIERSFRHNTTEYGIAINHGLEYFWTRLGDTTLYIDIPNIRPERKGGEALFILVSLLLLFALYHLILRLIRPLNTLIAGVRRFGKGELDHRIRMNRRDELGELADSFNDMADDIEQMLDAKRQLLLAISHELRSPLTRAKVSLELMEDGSQREELAKDLNEMEALIEELLESERLSTRHRALNRQRHDLNGLIYELLRQHFPDIERNPQLVNGSTIIDVDGTRIKLLLKNLLQNALRHTPDSAPPPQIMLERRGKMAIIIVKDFGRGVEAEQIPHLTEPFYRADASRHRETGGYGLGLYLCRVIAEAHGGTLEIESEVGKGTTVRVKLPL